MSQNNVNSTNYLLRTNPFSKKLSKKNYKQNSWSPGEEFAKFKVKSLSVESGF